VIVCDNNHLLLPFIRTSFLKRVGKTLEDSIVIVDEAHNLWERTRQELSSSLKPQSLERAEKELKENDLPSAGLKKIRKELKSLAEAKLGKTQFGESLVSRQEFFDCLEQEPGDFVEAMEESARKTVLRGGRRSNCGAIAEFVESWVASDETRFARIISPESLELKCLDASEETKALNCARSCVSMSGTLLPLEMHRDLLGFDGERTDLLEFKSPFPQSNRLNLIETGVTTRFSKRSPTEFEKIASKIQELIDAMKGRELAVFFPSFSVLERIIPLISSQNLVVQRGESGAVEKEQTIKEFRESRGVLCAVLGGALSEGIDYDKQEIKCIAIVGIPFAEISLEQQKLVEYLQKKFGKGWDYGYVLPAMNKALQAAGRGIRSERDKCAVIFMDERYSWVNYRKFFPSDFEAQATRSPWIEVKKFLGN
jgi:DNA excision repair protein ERCC-2